MRSVMSAVLCVSVVGCAPPERRPDAPSRTPPPTAVSPRLAASDRASTPGSVDACVPIPEESFYVQLFHGSSSRATSLWTFANEKGLDFDGDGTADVMVPQPQRGAPMGTCPSDVEWDLFLRRGECGGVYAGRVRARPTKVADSGGTRHLEAAKTNVGPMRNPVVYRYVFSSGQFHEVEVKRSEQPTRCEVHPQDCVAIHCRLAGHPDGHFDYRALDVELAKARSEARQCAAGAKTRCEASIELEPATGQASVVKLSGCGSASACVRRALERMAVSPYAGRYGKQQVGLSFELSP